MTKTDIFTLLTAKYSISNLKELLRTYFTSCDLFSQPKKIGFENEGHRDFAKSIHQLGTCKLADNTSIAFFEVELRDQKRIGHNRVGLRNLLVNQLQPGNLDAILAVYFHQDSNNWRISLISKSLSWDQELKQIKFETHPRRYTFVVGEQETIHTAVDRFELLLQHTSAIKLEQLLEAFSVEKISTDFFKHYYHFFKGFQEFLIDSGHFDWFKRKAKELHAEDIKKEAELLVRNFVKKLMGRIVFLYFLQKKGWLGVPKNGIWGDGDKSFISNLFKSFEDKKSFYSTCLVPLFFDTLNRKRHDDIFSITKTKVPYLNGGLFEKDSVEPDELKIKPQLFEELFTFFDSYNFTIDENSPEDQDIGVDPEMLGRIFENLLEENLKSARGTFYTPKEVVHYMCKESLKAYLFEKLKGKITPNEEKAITAFVYQVGEYNPEDIRKHAPALDAALSTVKICDPAIGSGAFPMGMVYEILRLKKELFGFVKGHKTFDYGAEKLAIIRNSIHGVDIDQGAIDISRLRFWLSLIVDEDEPKPLPNLDYRIMQGDSLREWYEGIDISKIAIKDIGLGQITLGFVADDVKKGDKVVLTEENRMLINNDVAEYFSSDNAADKKKLRLQIDKTIHKTLVAVIDNEIKRQEILIEENFARKTQKMIDREKAKLKEIKLSKERLLEIESLPEKPFFLWNLFFGDVLRENKGFDIVIGNPPYGVKVGEDVTEHYQITSKDSYSAFISLGLGKLLKTNGTLCYIVSDTWLTIKSHLQLRNQILDWQLQKVIRLHQDCFHATVNSCIMSVRKERFNTENSHKVVAADYTNVSTRKNTADFRSKLFHLDQLIGESTPDFGVYTYPQSLLFTNHNHPVIVGSPKLFALMQNVGCEIEEISIQDRNNVKARRVLLGKNETKVLRFGDVADSPHGISTGNNKAYVRALPGTQGGYSEIEDYMILAEKKLHSLNDKEKIEGLDVDWKSNKACFVPFEKGGEADTDDGWLPNYFVPTNYYINWGKGAIKDMKKNPGFRWINVEYFFREGLTFSISGIYAPTFRLNSSGVFEAKGSGIFSSVLEKERMLAILCSKVAKYIFKNYIKHTIDTSGDDIAEFPLAVQYNNKITELVHSIVSAQKKKKHYNYFENEQKQIDALVYQLYNLTHEDINEVEIWFARRYPKLAKYADIKPWESFKKKSDKPEQEQIKNLIATGENKTLEFKQTLRFDIKEKKVNLDVEWSCIKTIAAFINSEGGQLLIGVADDGTVSGLESDFNTFSDTNKQDAFLKHLENILTNTLGITRLTNISSRFIEIDGKLICIVEVKSDPEPLIIVYKQKNNREDFYVRRFASSVPLTMREMLEYLKNRNEKKDG